MMSQSSIHSGTRLMRRLTMRSATASIASARVTAEVAMMSGRRSCVRSMPGGGGGRAADMPAAYWRLAGV